MSKLADSTAANSTEEARFEAQRLAFAPIAFQATRLLRDKGILEAARAAGPAGLSFEELCEQVAIPEYGVRVLVEAGLGIGLLNGEDDRFSITKTGFFILRDKLTRVNLDFVQHCCYNAMAHLEEAIESGEPAGLRVFGDWDRLYEGIPLLPEPARQSWLDFDHLYSDSAFPAVLPIVFRDEPKKILDIGGNTGRWAIQCTSFSSDVAVTILDLANVIEEARENLAAHGLEDRVSVHAMDLLDHEQSFPSGFDVLWMSQLLVCFSERDAVALLRRAASAMSEESVLYILDTCWDRQRHAASRYSLQATSLYFTCLANGRSRMYKASDIEGFVDDAGLQLVERTDGIGICHSLFECRRSS